MKKSEITVGEFYAYRSSGSDELGSGWLKQACVLDETSFAKPVWESGVRHSHSVTVKGFQVSLVKDDGNLDTPINVEARQLVGTWADHIRIHKAKTDRKQSADERYSAIELAAAERGVDIHIRRDSYGNGRNPAGYATIGASSLTKLLGLDEA
jgi:hypothetical protein